MTVSADRDTGYVTSLTHSGTPSVLIDLPPPAPPDHSTRTIVHARSATVSAKIADSVPPIGTSDPVELPGGTGAAVAVGVGSVAVAVVLPSAATQPARLMAVARLGLCGAPPQPPSRLEHPLQAPVATAKFSSADAAMDARDVDDALALHGGGALLSTLVVTTAIMAAGALRRRLEPHGGSPDLADSASRLRWAAHIAGVSAAVFAAYLAPSVAASGTVLLSWTAGSSPADGVAIVNGRTPAMALGAFALMASAGAVAWALFVTQAWLLAGGGQHRKDDATSEVSLATSPALEVCHGAMFAAAPGAAAWRQAHYAVDVALACAVGALSSTDLGAGARCDAIAVLVIAVPVAGAVYVLIGRPLKSRVDTAFTGAGYAVQAVAGVLVWRSRRADDGRLDAIADGALVVQTAVVLAHAAVDLVRTVLARVKAPDTRTIIRNVSSESDQPLLDIPSAERSPLPASASSHSSSADKHLQTHDVKANPLVSSQPVTA